MKYASFDYSTFQSKEDNDKDDPSGIGCLLRRLADAERPADPTLTFLSYATHPAIQRSDPHRCVQVEAYGCPVCKEVYFSIDSAERCNEVEVEFNCKFYGLEIGSWLRWRAKSSNDFHNAGDTAYTQVKAFSHRYSGSRCGNLVTIHTTNGNSFDASSCSDWSMSSQQEKYAYDLATMQEQRDRLNADILAKKHSGLSGCKL